MVLVPPAQASIGQVPAVLISAAIPLLGLVIFLYVLFKRMRLLLEAVSRLDDASSPEELASDMLAELRAQKKRAPGFGHRIHTDDPRTKRLLSLAEELNVSGDGVLMARTFEKTLEEKLGRRLPLNVDGALAALLVDLGFPPELGNAFFIIARVTGLAAHTHEEVTRQRPMRRIHPTDHEYDGPAPRELA